MRSTPGKQGKSTPPKSHPSNKLNAPRISAILIGFSHLQALQVLKETSYLLDISTTWLLVPSIIVIFDGQALYIITHKRAPLLYRRLVTNSILIDYAPENGTARPLSKISVVTMSKADTLQNERAFDTY